MILRSTSSMQVEVSVKYLVYYMARERILYYFCSVNWYLCVDVSERVKLKRSDYPLVLRVMQGPCEQVCKVFLMEEDLGEEVTYDVSHHIHC